ncbi:flippase [Candidatus Bipolaricaulota bacterium]|nr:flippase [Candidatus Bipolaricaulota bacterium]
MSTGKFVRGTTVTFGSGVLNLLVGVGTSVILARVLGPEGRGIYALAALLPSLIVTFGNLGIGPATVYYVARGEFRRQEILGNNVLLSLGVGGIGILTGLIVILFFREIVFPGVLPGYLLLALALVPVEVFFSYVRYVLLGAQRIKEFNYVQIAQSVLFLGFIALALLGLKAEVTGAILAGLITWLVVDALVFRLAKTVAGGIDLKPNASYMKRTTTYGVQAHLSNILGFLNYRVDMFLVNGFLGPVAVGLYAVGVGLVEKLWMISQAASTVLFPRVAAETDEQRRREFTPLVARTVLWTTALGALALALLSRWIVLLLYSEAFLPAVGALQALLVGIVALSAGRVLSNDIAGRGRPGLNIYTGVAAVATNVILNIIWIPRYGIAGAAWASTASYTLSFLGALFFYCRLSGNRWTEVVLPQRGDWKLYQRTAWALGQWVKAKTRTLP